MQERLHAIQTLSNFRAGQFVLVEVFVEEVGSCEIVRDGAVAQFRSEASDRAKVMAMPAMLPTPLLSDGLQHEGGGTPTLLRSLPHIAGGEFGPRLSQKMVA